MKQSVTVGAQLLWGGRYGCSKGCYGCTIVMSYIEINKAVSQWLLTFNLCVSVTWPLTCAFHIPCTHTPEIIDMHRGVCDNSIKLKVWLYKVRLQFMYSILCSIWDFFHSVSSRLPLLCHDISHSFLLYCMISYYMPLSVTLFCKIPLYWYGLDLHSAWFSDNIHYRSWMKLIIYSQTSTVYP